MGALKMLLVKLHGESGGFNLYQPMMAKEGGQKKGVPNTRDP